MSDNPRVFDSSQVQYVSQARANNAMLDGLATLSEQLDVIITLLKTQSRIAPSGYAMVDMVTGEGR